MDHSPTDDEEAEDQEASIEGGKHTEGNQHLGSKVANQVGKPITTTRHEVAKSNPHVTERRAPSYGARLILQVVRNACGWTAPQLNHLTSA